MYTNIIIRHNYRKHVCTLGGGGSKITYPHAVVNAIPSRKCIIPNVSIHWHRLWHSESSIVHRTHDSRSPRDSKLKNTLHSPRNVSCHSRTRHTRKQKPVFFISSSSLYFHARCQARCSLQAIVSEYAQPFAFPLISLLSDLHWNGGTSVAGVDITK